MTDINNWPELVRAEGHYTLIPLSAYQMGNLLDALTQAEENGDWFHELQDIIAVAMKKQGLQALTSNRGRQFTYEQVANRGVPSAVR